MIDNIIKFSIKNKAVIFLLTIGLVIGGFYSMTKVPVDAVPDITNNQVQVITTASSLSTEDIERFVTYQVELAVSNLPGVVEIRSISRFGLSVVTIVFEDDMGTFLPRQLVSEAISKAKEEIPKGFGEPFMAPVSTGLGEIYQYSLEVLPGYESQYDITELRTIQDWIVKRQMSMIPGVVEVNSFGGKVKQYEVSIDPDKLKSAGVTMADLFEALEANNKNAGGAYIEKNHKANFIRGEGLIRSVDDIKNTVVKTRNGQAIFVRDLAEVKYGSAVRYGAFTKDGKGEAVGGIVMMLKGENSNDVIKRVKERITLIQKSLPEGITIKPFLDRSKMIKNTTSTLAKNLSMGALIVVFILVFFLGSFRSGFIVASTIPLSMLFAFIMMHIFDVWANLMSLGALDFGILVDGAVIIVESMIFYLTRKNMIGKVLSPSERDELAYKSASKMMGVAFFGQLIILIVFVPVLTLHGVEGKMFKPMAMTFGFAILGVMVLSLTYVPAMAAMFLQPPKSDKKTWGEQVLAFTKKLYLPVLNTSLKYAKTVILVAFLLMVAGIFTFLRMGAEFIPQLDEGDLAFHAFLKPGSSLSETIKTTTKLERIVLKNFPDEVESVQSRIGVADVPTDPMPMDIADIFVIMKPKKMWKKIVSKQDFINQLREKIEILPGINFEFSQPVEMRFNELLMGVREDISIKLYGDDLDILAEKAQEIKGMVAGIEGIAGINAEAIKGLPRINIKYKREDMGRYGLTITKLNRLIETAFSGAVAGKIYEGERMFDLVIRLDEVHRKSIDDIRNLYIDLDDGVQIPLKEVADINYQAGPMQISRDNTNRRTYVGLNVEDRDIKSIVKDIQKVLDEKLSLPPGYYIRYGGAFENLQRATARLYVVVPLVLALIFILVYFAIKSIKLTLMIYLSIPFAALGGIFALYFRDMPFSISAAVGFIVLFGVAVLNGLVLISSFKDLKQSGTMSLRQVIQTGTLRRMRPILLTASTDILGFLPMALSASAGAEVQRPLATVVIGGIITSTILTLLVLPALYNLVESRTFAKLKYGIAKPVVATVIVFLIFNINLKAQSHTFSLEEAITKAKEVYPSLKIAGLQIEKEKLKKSTVFDLGSTGIYTGMEEWGKGNTGVFNIIGIEQSDMDFLAIPVNKKLNEAEVQKAVAGKKIQEKSLVRDVSIAWYNAYFAKRQLYLYRELDSVYAGFVKAARIKYETQSSSKIAYLSALGKHKELIVAIKKAESEYRSALSALNKYLMVDGQIETGDLDEFDGMFLNDFEKFSEEDNVLSDYYHKDIELNEARWQVAKAAYLPKFNAGYKFQALDGVAGFHAWQIGMSIPVSTRRYKMQRNTAKLDIEISKYRYVQYKAELQATVKDMMNKYRSEQEALAFYEEEAVPLAEEQLKAARTAYQLGSIDYIQFIQNVESAIKTKQEFLKRKREFYILLEELRFMIN